MTIKRDTPLGLTLRYSEETGETIVSWSYIEDADIEYFELEIWDSDRRKWVPYDNFYGIVKKG